MSYHKVKFAAGGGKTTAALKYLQEHKGGLYLAFNKKVVNDIELHGFLSKTFDSLFQSYIIPKCVNLIPIISKYSKIRYLDQITKEKRDDLKQVCNLRIDENGMIYYLKNSTKISVNNSNYYVKNQKDNGVKYSKSIYKCFGYKETWITDELRKDIMLFLLKNYPQEIASLIIKRFNYIIIDEAQDMKNHIESFARILIGSNIYVILYGDEYQNINQGGDFFESLKVHETKEHSHRCSEGVCSWIRNNLNIKIYGESKLGEYILISEDSVSHYDNGKRTILYKGLVDYNRILIENWKGPKFTIQESKGMTINGEIVIIGKSMSPKFLYTAITRSTSNVFSTVSKNDINDI